MADNYLKIAEQVLQIERRPLGTRDILTKAYLLDLVPYQLYGKTQHKTLGARLSEDILINKDKSAFFRTAPGRFFLRSFLSDPTINLKFRRPIVARRRKRQLLRENALTISRETAQIALSHEASDPKGLLGAFSDQMFHYARHPKKVSQDELLIWAFVLVMKDDYVLTYRHGQYKEERDGFLNKRSIGFFSPVTELDNDLFSGPDLGITAAGLKAIVMDLDLPSIRDNEEDYEKRSTLKCIIRVSASKHREDVLAVISFKCPDWFEPLNRNLAINDLNWKHIRTQINDIDDLDPWSQKVLSWAKGFNIA